MKKVKLIFFKLGFIERKINYHSLQKSLFSYNSNSREYKSIKCMFGS